MSVKTLQKLQDWISTYPGWETGSTRVCMLPKGLEELSRALDVQGNIRAGCRYYVTLHWEMPTLEDEWQNAQRLLRFVQWVQYQSAVGHAPVLGDVPASERLRTEKTGLTPGAQTVAYTVTLVADFMKVYEVK